MNFSELSKLKRNIDELLENQVISLKHYHLDTGGFKRKPLEDSLNFSKASTATCISSIAATGYWTNKHIWYKHTSTLINEMLDNQNWTSAKLPNPNPFTVAFLMEGVCTLLEKDPSMALTELQKASKQEAAKHLKNSLRKRRPHGVPGAAHLLKYPPSAYVTQLVVRSLVKMDDFPKDLKTKVRDWSWGCIEHELALYYSESSLADPYALAYSVILFATCSDSSKAKPSETQILKAAVTGIFKAQLSDGSWPRSRPLFHYPETGNAYCYEYEMLTQLLQCEDLKEHLLEHLPELALAVNRLRQIQFHLDREKGLGWASGHHPQLRGPESWSTASVYHFLYVLDRLLAESFRRSVFSYIGAEYSPPTTPKKKYSEFATNFWDSKLKYPKGKKLSLRKTLFDILVKPVAKHSENVANGNSIPKDVPISAIFFGPPGTSKTQLADEISKFLGWPRLSIDPSHLVRKGLDQVQAETNTVFEMLASIEQVVVLLDEFDEMVRDRADNNSETLSRFLTTAMLPKLALISERRGIVLILATNHIEAFDFAVRRPGRFDMTVQIMPPSWEAKLAHNEAAKTKLEEYGTLDKKHKTMVTSLTFAEFNELAKIIQKAITKENLEGYIEDCHERCSLSQDANKDGSWGKLCEKQSLTSNRIPRL